MTDLNKSSLSEIVNLIKSKKISSSEITNHYIKNIERCLLLKVGGVENNCLRDDY